MNRGPVGTAACRPSGRFLAHADGLETAALRELLSRRRKGKFFGAEQMDSRLIRMIANKRR